MLHLNRFASQIKADEARVEASREAIAKLDQQAAELKKTSVKAAQAAAKYKAEIDDVSCTTVITRSTANHFNAVGETSESHYH